MTPEIYLDYAATTPLDDRVRDRIVECLDSSGRLGNPAAAHAFGARAAVLLEAAAAEVAGLVNAHPGEIVWTSGATESDNLAIIGAARFRRMRGQHIVTTAIEHKAVLASCRLLEAEGYEVTYVAPDPQGVVQPAAIEAAIRPETTLVSVMHANNETGAIQDIGTIGRLCRSLDVLLHVDAAQTVGKLTLDVRALNIDLMSLNAHKACGPAGVGALYLNSDRIGRLEPMLRGGEQQRGLRAGTLGVHQVVGMGATFRVAGREMAAEVPRVQALRDRLWHSIADVPGVQLNCAEAPRLCSILNVSVAGVEGESLRYALGELAVSSGSACNSASAEPSYVLRSLGLSDSLAEASVRFSLGRFTTTAEIDRAGAVVRDAVALLRSYRPGEAA